MSLLHPQCGRQSPLQPPGFPRLGARPDSRRRARFLSEFRGSWTRHGLSVFGITTDGSSLTPGTQGLWPEARTNSVSSTSLRRSPRQCCTRCETAQGDDRADPQARRPAQERAGGQAWLIAYRKRCVAELFEHRYLFVRHSPHAARRAVQKLTTGGRDCKAAETWTSVPAC